MKKGKSVLTRQVLAGLLAGVLLGSVGYVQPAAAQIVKIETQTDYIKAGNDVKDSNGHIVISGSASGNQVTIGTADGGDVPLIGTGTGSSEQKNVYGGHNGSAAVTNNQVYIHSGQMGKVYGGETGASNSSATGNSVIISGGTSGTVYGGSAYREGGLATGNRVIISGGTSGTVYGGYAGNRGIAKGNSVHISGGTVESGVYGGSTSASGDVTGNSIYISGGTIKGGVVCAGMGDRGTVTGNEVLISGGMISDNVYGGMGNGATVTGNSVTISGTPKFGENTVLYGGYADRGTVSGNILNIHTKDLTVANVKGFDVYNFYLQNDTQAGNTLLTLTGGNGSDKSTSLDGSTINVGMEGSAPALQVGDSVILVKNENGITGDVTYGKIKDGVSIEYEFTTELEGGTALVSRVTRAGISADSKSPVETQLAAVAFINSGADLLAGSGVSSAVTAAGGGNAEMFGAMSGGSMRYKSGSYADVHGYNLALGVGKAIANKAGQLTFGPFVEYGHGNYTSYLDSGVRGDGNTKYYGIGMLARQDNTSGVYYEGSLRYGRMDADYGSNDMTTGTMGKVHTHYDSSSAYYGAHLGIGKVTELDDSAKADIYAKLLYTHQRGDSVTLQGQGAREEYDFDAVDSTRARVGARVSKAYGERGSGYVGVAYEYEFDGEARAAVKGFSTPSPSIKGSSGLLELGYILQPKAANDPAINIGLQGWGGKKQGFTGNVNFVWTF